MTQTKQPPGNPGRFIDAAAAKMEQSHHEARPDQANEGAVNPRADLRDARGHDQDARAKCERVWIGLRDTAENMDEPH